MPCSKNIYEIYWKDRSDKEVRSINGGYIGRTPTNATSLRPTRKSYRDDNGKFVTICSPGQILVMDGIVGKWIHGEGYLTDKKELVLIDYTITKTYIRNNSPRQVWS